MNIKARKSTRREILKRLNPVRIQRRADTNLVMRNMHKGSAWPVQEGLRGNEEKMKYINFDESRPMDIVLLGRVAIDFNPAYNDQVKEEFKPLKKVHMFEKYVGGSPANIAVGVTRHGLKAGFLGKVSDDQFGDFVVDYFNEQGIDTSHITRCTGGQKLGLTFTEMLSPKESHILMYRNCIADLQLHVDDIDEDYIKNTKALLISGTVKVPSRTPSRKLKFSALTFSTTSLRISFKCTCLIRPAYFFTIFSGSTPQYAKCPVSKRRLTYSASVFSIIRSTSASSCTTVPIW